MNYDIWCEGKYIKTVKATSSQEAKIRVAEEIGIYVDLLTARPNDYDWSKMTWDQN